MRLVQILLPLYGNDGAPQPTALFGAVRAELSERFGGLTAYSRAPAEGVWRQGGSTSRDDIVVIEVMDSRFDPVWWRGYRRDLERRFRQESIVARAQEIELL